VKNLRELLTDGSKTVAEYFGLAVVHFEAVDRRALDAQAAFDSDVRASSF
jgi:hypothetical protein